MANTAENDANHGIALFPQNGRDFQPLATGENVGAYAQATAVIVDQSYKFNPADVIEFTLSSSDDEASFLDVPGQPAVTSVRVEPLESWPGVFGVFEYGPKFQSPSAKTVVLNATLVCNSNSGKILSGSREFTFIDPLPVATKDRLGGVKGGRNVNIETDGTLWVDADGSDYVLPEATDVMLGGVKQGKYVTIDRGTLSVNPATLTPDLKYAEIESCGVVKFASSEEVSVGDPAVKKAVTPGDIKNLYAPLTNPTFDGAVTVNKDQTASGALIAPRELVTGEWVQSQLPNIHRCTSEYLDENSSTNLYYAFSVKNFDSILILDYDAPKKSSNTIRICLDMQIGDCISVVNPTVHTVTVYVGLSPQSSIRGFSVEGNTKAGCILVAENNAVNFTAA